MHLLLVYIRCILIINEVQGSLQIINITTRVPKPKDIGIIFDVTMGNLDECEESLAYSIRPNGYCCVNVTPDMIMRKMGRIVGGDFGFIEPGAIQKISLILPTVSLYDRVGFCPIVLSSINANNEKLAVKQMINFDTRYEVLYHNPILIEQKSFIDRRTLKNCTQVDCQGHYFHLRCFCNTTSEKYQELAPCSVKYRAYEPLAEEDTISPGKVLKAFEESKPDDYVWELRSDINQDQLNKSYDKFAYDFNKRSQLHREANKKWLQRTMENNRSEWLFGLGKALLIVFVTITIYLMICFSIFLCVTWLSRRSNRNADKSGRGEILSTHHMELSEETIPLYTTCSLMSHH